MSGAEHERAVRELSQAMDRLWAECRQSLDTLELLKPAYRELTGEWWRTDSYGGPV